MKKAFEMLKKNLVGIALLLIMLSAFFVRVYNFEDWLYFKMDQSRDAILLSKALENGPGYLPLLGARAGAVKLSNGFLRLGPIDYYFQYLSGVLFGSTEAQVFAYPNLLFSILALPLLYLFARFYFSKRNSLLIVAMYAFSFIIIQYSRFTWNPNSLQFFLLLSFYGLLRFLNEENEKKKKWWLVAWTIGITIGSQLHFFGFFSLLGVSGLMVLWHYQLWKKQNVLACFKKDVVKIIAKYVGIAFAIFLVFYTPVIISDIYEKGKNTKNFFEAIIAKPEKKSLSEKITKDIEENARYYCLLTTSQCYGSSLKKEYPAIVVAMLIMFSGLVLIVRKLRKKTLTMKQRDFLVLLIMWLGVFTILTIPVSFQLRPRFFIVVFAIPFLFLGLLFEFLDEKIKKKYALVISIFLAAGIIAWNCRGTYAWFKEQANSQKKTTAAKRTLILKAKDGVTLGQLKNVTDWMYARHKAGLNLYYYIKPEHVRPINFLLSQKKDKDLNYKKLSINNQDPNAQFFAITTAKSELTAVQKKFGNEVVVLDSKQFGQLRVYEIEFPNRITSQEYKFKRGKQIEDRLYWKDVLNFNQK